MGFDERMAYADTSVGLKNVRERLLIYYKDAAFEIHSLPGQGTLITITIAEKDLKYADINSR